MKEIILRWLVCYEEREIESSKNGKKVKERRGRVRMKLWWVNTIISVKFVLL